MPDPEYMYEMTGSPCVKVCELANGVCKGCHRTRAEIAGWNRLDKAERDSIVERIVALCGNPS